MPDKSDIIGGDGTVAPPTEYISPVEAQPVLDEGDAASKLPAVPQGKSEELRSNARAFVDAVSSMNPMDTSFRAQLAGIDGIGKEAFRSTGDLSGRFLQQSLATVGNSTAQAEVTSSLAELRDQVTELAPRSGTFSGLLARLPFANSTRKYFRRYETNQKQLAQIMVALQKGSDGLTKDNAELTVVMKDLYADMEELSKANVLLNGLQDAVKDRIEVEKAAGNVEMAKALETEVLSAVLQRRQDVVTQAAVTMQAYFAMGITQKNNDQLIRGVERAQTTTMTALRTAVIVAQALDNQKLVLDQIDAVNKTTNDLIDRTSRMLQENTLRIQQQAVGTGVDADTLKRAFDSVFATLDSIDEFREQANGIMEKNIDAIEQQVGRAKDRIEARQKALDSPGTTSASGYLKLD